jgi:hypothetical protein
MPRTRFPLLLVLATLMLVVSAAAAQASSLVDRNARNVRLEVNRRGIALVLYRTSTNATVRHVLYWGGINRSLDFAYDRSGGSASGRGNWRTFRNFCQPYDGPALFAVVAACKAPDGSYWALQSWAYHIANYGGQTGARELRLSHWTGPTAVIWAKGDWSWRGRYHHMYGQLTYQGKPVIPFKVSGVGAVLDKRGRNVAVDSLNSDMGRGWRRVNAMLAGRPTGEFCLGFTPKGTFTRKTGRSRVGQYRVSVAGPFVTPDLRVNFAGPGSYDPAVDASANGEQHALTQGHRGGSCFPQN